MNLSTENSTRVQAPTLIQPAVASTTSDNEVNDAVHPNPTGRCTVDSKTNKAGKNTKIDKKLLKCKDKTLIATLNVRTLRKEDKRIELARIFNATNIHILGVVDHKIVHEDEDIKTEQLNNCTLITSSAWRNESNASSGGVGVLINKKLEDTLSTIDTINKRIIVASFNGNPKSTIIVHYSPTEGSSDAEEHYKNLINVINTIPKHNVTMVIGDFNAHIGKDDARHTFHEKTNNNGRLLLDMVEETNLIITNTTFQKKKGKLWTFISDMSHAKSQIDYILINKKWKNSIKNVEAYSSFASVGSDHRIVTAHVKLSLRSTKPKVGKKMFDWSTLKDDADLQHRYTIQIKNRYSALRENSDDNDATEIYQHLIQANKETAEELMPTKKRSKRNNAANDPKVVEARDKVNSAFSNYQKEQTHEKQHELQEQKTNLESAYNQVFEDELKELVREVEDANSKHQHALSWKLINQISGRKVTKKGIINGKSKEDRVKSWYNHFSQLLGKEPNVLNSDKKDDDDVYPHIFEDLTIETGPFVMEELQKALKSLKVGKSAGEDGIPPEVLKYCQLDELVLDHANNLLLHGNKPRQWSDINLLPLPKTGNLSLTSNYRGIGLSSIVAKLVNKMILNRVQPVLDPLLRPNQNGFRPGRSTTAHILALRRIIEGVKRKDLKAALLFLDFSKAFDSVHRGKLIKILRAYGIPDQIVNAISKLYESTRAKVLSPDGETDYFEIIAGVLQGDTLAPYLFVITIDFIMRNAIGNKAEELGFTVHPKKSRRIPAVVVTDLDFADDIALLSNDIEQAKKLLSLVEVEAAKIGLHANAKKTQVMLFNQDSINDIKSISGGKIKDVEDFKYLGGWIASTEKDLKVRKALAWTACHKLKKIWASSLNKKMKIRLFLATVESVLLYNSETWSLTKQMEKSLDGQYTRMLRMALDVSWKLHMTNEELYAGLPKVSVKISERRLKLAGHCVRHSEEIASQLILWEPSRGRSKRGRKPVDYIDLIKRDTGLENPNEIRNSMLDRDVWKKFIRLARSGDRPK